MVYWCLLGAGPGDDENDTCHSMVGYGNAIKDFFNEDCEPGDENFISWEIECTNTYCDLTAVCFGELYADDGF